MRSQNHLEYKILKPMLENHVVVTNSSLKEKSGKKRHLCRIPMNSLSGSEFIRGYLQSVESSTTKYKDPLFITDRCWADDGRGRHIPPLSSADNALYQKRKTEGLFLHRALSRGRHQGEVLPCGRDIPERILPQEKSFYDGHRDWRSQEILKNANTYGKMRLPIRVNRENIIHCGFRQLHAGGILDCPENCREIRYSRWRGGKRTWGNKVRSAGDILWAQ